MTLKTRKTRNQERASRPASFAKDLAQSLREAVDYVRGHGPARVTEWEIPSAAPSYTPREVVAIRKRLGMTQKRFARLMNVSDQSVEGWESGKKSPGPASRRLMQLTADPDALQAVAGLAGFRLIEETQKSKRASKTKHSAA